MAPQVHPDLGPTFSFIVLLLSLDSRRSLSLIDFSSLGKIRVLGHVAILSQ